LKKPKTQTEFHTINEVEQEKKVVNNQFDSQDNLPISQGQASHGELAKVLLDYTQKLYSKSKIAKREMLTMTKSIWYADHYSLMSLLKWNVDYVTLKMSEEGWMVDNVLKPYERLLQEQGIAAKAKSRIQELVDKV